MVLEKTLESPLDCKIQPVHPKGDQSWVFIGRTDAEAEILILLPPDAEELTHLRRPWCWERLRAGGEGDDRGWDGWMASPTRWTWVWVDSGSWWWTGRPGVLRFTGSQRVRHDWATELSLLMLFLGFISYNTLCFLDLSVSCLMLGEFSALISSVIFSGPFSLLLWDAYNAHVVVFNIVRWSLRLSSFLFILFLYCLTVVISTTVVFQLAYSFFWFSCSGINFL